MARKPRRYKGKEGRDDPIKDAVQEAVARENAEAETKRRQFEVHALNEDPAAPVDIAPMDAAGAAAGADASPSAPANDTINEVDLDEVVEQLKTDVRDAVAFQEEFETERQRAQEYYNGRSSVPVDGNGSRYVATKVRDTIRAVRPSLLRIFLSSVTPVEFLPSGNVPPLLARQQTKYVTEQFEQNGGYMTCYEAFQTAMLQRMGAVQYWWEETEHPYSYTYEGVTEEQLAALQANPAIMLVNAEQTGAMPGMAPNGEPIQKGIFEVTCQYSKTTGKLAMRHLPVHEFLFSDEANNIDDPRVIGRQYSITISDLITQNPQLRDDFEKLAELDDYEVEATRGTGESAARRKYYRHHTVTRSRSQADQSMKRISITDVFYKADLDGTGVAKCYRFLLGGTSLELLDYEEAEDGHNFAIFQIDPSPSTLMGTSIYDITHEDQDGLTSLTRSVLNNAHKSNNPRLGVHESLVSMQDVLNEDIGSPIRFRAPGMIQPIEVPFTAGQTIPLIENWNRDVEVKTGVTRASIGLDPQSLQSTDKEAVKNTIAAAQGQVEVYARNLAETGMERLFRGILRLCMRHQNPNQVMWITGDEYEPVNLAQFDPTLNMKVNVGLGSGNDEQRALALQGVMTMQKEIVGQYGLQQPIVQPHHMTNAMEDALGAIGLRSISRYMSPLTPPQSQQLVQADAAAKEAEAQKPDPQLETIRQIESIKAQTQILVNNEKAVVDARKAALNAEVNVSEGERKDDLERDKMLQDLILAVENLRLEHKQVNIDARNVNRQQELN